jgi:hypothetical protein
MLIGIISTFIVQGTHQLTGTTCLSEFLAVCMSSTVQTLTHMSPQQGEIYTTGVAMRILILSRTMKQLELEA